MKRLLHGFRARMLFCAGVLLLPWKGSGLAADAPSWWTRDEAPVLVSGKDPDNFAIANIGQAKWMAKNALEVLGKVLPSVAGEVEADLVGAGKPIPDWNPPATAGERGGQHAPLLIGQLKAIAAPFYQRIHVVAPDWLASERVIYQMPGTGTFYPWTLSTTDDSNRAPATIGQLKAVFSLDFTADREEAGDAIPDLWEHAVVNADPHDAWTGIGDINAQNARQAATETQSNPPPRDPLAPVEAVWKVDARSSWYHYLDSFPGECFILNENARVSVTHNSVARTSRQQLLDLLNQDCPFAATPPAGAAGLTDFYNHVMAGPFGEQRIWSQGRVWLTVNPAPLAPVSKTMLLVRNAVEDEGSSVTVADVLHFTVPAGQTRSIPQDVVHAPEDPEEGSFRQVTYDLIPIELTLHRRGTINTPGVAIPRPTDGNSVYEVVTLENADFDEQANWVPILMASAGETHRQDALNHANQAVDRDRDDDFVKIRLHAALPQMPGNIELVMDQAGQGDRMQADDLRFYNNQGQRVASDQLRIENLQNPQGPLAPMLQADGLDLFVEIADLGQLTQAGGQAIGNQRRYADLILRLTVDGRVMEQRARIYRGGYWRNQRDGNTGILAFYDGKGRHQDQSGAWQVDAGNLVHGPFNILSGAGTTDETVEGRGPTPAGWYGLFERTDFRTWWAGGARPQTDHAIGRNGQPLGYLQQGSYCQWSGPGNRTAYTHQGANPPSSVRFKFELVPWGHNAHGRTFLQIHPDGFNDGTSGCVGIQVYNDCCRVFFFLRNYFGSCLNVGST